MQYKYKGVIVTEEMLVHILDELNTLFLRVHQRCSAREQVDALLALRKVLLTTGVLESKHFEEKWGEDYVTPTVGRSPSC